ncbi:MAG TPA: rhodanese-like domain-containing protein [Phycisphaerales bacterium]|nr:rhodanese-like domain-containing protein [Phycisphaerales bacterium]HMP37871.1 rhodanese-like domain-containing protein [Phycisphaerales bacterium]
MPRFPSLAAALLVLCALVATACSTDLDDAAVRRGTPLRDGPLLSGSEAAALLLSGKDVLVIDAGPPNLFAERRVRGATHADYGTWLDRTERDPMDPDFVDAWRRDLASDGVTGAPGIIIYGRPGSYSAPATTWYGLQSVGVERVWVVSGGFEAIAEHLPEEWIERGPRESSSVGRPQPVDPGDRRRAIDPGDASDAGDLSVPGDSDGPDRVQAAPRADAFRPDHTAARCPLAMKRDVLAALTDGRTTIIDVRRPTEFAGTETRGNPRPGRIPGAIHLEHTQLVAEDGRFKPAEEIRRTLAELGVRPHDPLILYCQSGGRSAALALALTDSGFTAVRNYFGSFREWSADGACPVEVESVAAESVEAAPLGNHDLHTGPAGRQP